MSVHNIVVIGASFGGITVAQGLLKTVIPQLSTGKQYKIIQIAPNDEFFWKIAAPRVIVNPDALPLSKALLPIEPHFKNYKPEQYEFIKAYVTSIDPSSKTVHTSTSAAIQYDSLVIASGTNFESPLWTVADGSEALKAALKEVHEKLPTAQTILVAGGGAAGVETSGELGELYGKKKDITILSGSTSLLPRLQNKKVGQDAQSRLEKMGVKVINDKLRVVSHTKEGGKEVLKLSNGETRTVDIFIDGTGDKPNSKFIPQEWLDDKQRVKTDAHTLRLDVPGVTGVYCIGAVGNYSDGSVMDIKFAKPAIVESIRSDLTGQAPGPRTKNIYKKFQSDMQIVPVGSQGGVGVLFGWKAPSFIVKMAKAKDFMIGEAVKLVDGTA
ncbi:AMID-like mitochondrial oxidoreductase [Exophiala viscosa]|uniref:AMID-like mitochondrial oxidoreductase n=1 Tax=Exophiala viscosa TaxID=2486360 RepID=A0AAN6E5R6_9EURO|nr:AMID-like mitochondrial oxidoreductase [Exophiala viscosa]KAI1626721.1 AMID-like mitochondrial oxidoreductase [Exophiala viscosa]